MNVFETIKAAVPMREAAEHYGLRVLPNGMACCPFHEDHHPSLKLNEDNFFCFGCGMRLSHSAVTRMIGSWRACRWSRLLEPI